MCICTIWNHINSSFRIFNLTEIFPIRSPPTSSLSQNEPNKIQTAPVSSQTSSCSTTKFLLFTNYLNYTTEPQKMYTNWLILANDPLNILAIIILKQYKALPALPLHLHYHFSHNTLAYFLQKKNIHWKMCYCTSKILQMPAKILPNYARTNRILIFYSLNSWNEHLTADNFLFSG